MPGVRYFLVLQTPESSSIIVSIGIRVCGHVSEGAGIIRLPSLFSGIRLDKSVIQSYDETNKKSQKKAR